MKRPKTSLCHMSWAHPSYNEKLLITFHLQGLGFNLTKFEVIWTNFLDGVCKGTDANFLKMAIKFKLAVEFWSLLQNNFFIRLGMLHMLTTFVPLP